VWLLRLFSAAVEVAVRRGAVQQTGLDWAMRYAVDRGVVREVVVGVVVVVVGEVREVEEQTCLAHTLSAGIRERERKDSLRRLCV